MAKIKTALSLLFLILLTTACSQPQQATAILEQQGYSDVKTYGWGLFTLFQCSNDDVFKTPFSATSANGSIVNGVVCSGILKGSTVRFN